MKRLLISVAVVLGMLLGQDVSAVHHKVLIVHSYHRSLAWVEQCNQGIMDILPHPLILEHVYLDTKRIPESEFQDRAEAAMDVFRRFQPDVVMLGDDNALRLLGLRISEAGTPVVFFGINNNPRRYFDTMPDNMTGVLERVPLFPWVRHLKQIMPEAKKALVLMDNSFTSKALVDVTFAERKKVFIDGVFVEYASTGDWLEWQRLVQESNGHDFIIMPVFHALNNDRGMHVSAAEVVRWTSEYSPVPVFASQDYAVSDDGVVGSFVIVGENHGRIAARIVKNILEADGSSIPHTEMDQSGAFYFNRQQLQRFGLTLPETIRQKSVFQ